MMVVSLITFSFCSLNLTEVSMAGCAETAIEMQKISINSVKVVFIRWIKLM